MNKKEIDELLSVYEDNCISIIIPTHRLAAGKPEDPVRLNKAIARVVKVLNGQPASEELLLKLDKICEEINFSHTKDGLGIFVSPSGSKLVTFPFPVTEKTVIGKSFDSRELLFYKSIADYYVVSATRKSIQLFKGEGEELSEITNEDFPLFYQETYEYTPPSLSSPESLSPKAYEKDKSVLQEIRFKDFLRSADKLLGKYMTPALPVILSGTKKEITNYKQITNYGQYIIGSIEGSHEYNKKSISSAAWKLMQEYIKHQNTALITQLHELAGKEMAVYGINNISQAAEEGKGLTLLVEKDLSYDTLPEKRSGKENVHPSDADPINSIIKMVMQKNGEIIFMDNGSLSNFDGMALILRYTDTYA